MAHTAVSLLINQQERFLTGVTDEVDRINRQIASIEPRLERIEATLAQPSANLEKWMLEFRIVTLIADDLIEAYVKRVQKSLIAGICKKAIYWIKLRGLRKKLKRINDDLQGVINSMPIEDVMMPGGSDALNTLDTSVPRYLRQCIYYFLLFPANVEVPTRRLIVLWVAEGLVRSNDNESAEQVAQRYLDELIHLEVVRVTKTKPNGKAIACRLEDVTKEAWLKNASNVNFLKGWTTYIRRLVDRNGTQNAPFIQIHGNPSIFRSDEAKYQDVISFLSFDTKEESQPGKDIGDFLHKWISDGCFRWLRVLDLEGVFRPKLPKTLRKLIGLKYLGLRWTCLERLPKFVNKLLNLKVLDVKHSYISVLPRSIWSMQYLRHLYLSETYRTRFVGRPSGVSLTDLQTLWGAFIDEDTCVTKGLDTLQNIRKLGLSCRSMSPDENFRMTEQLEAVDKWISKLTFLESLRLKSRDRRGNASDLRLTSLRQKEMLSTVYLLGRLQQSVVSEFPVNLIDITLSGSVLSDDPMEALGKLPKLLILKLLSESVVCTTMHCFNTGFPVLKVLKIWNLENLEQWEAEEGSLRSLEDLEIRSCKKLIMLPDGLQHVNTLQKFRLTSMPDGFIDESKDRQPHLWARIEQVLEVD